jgi:hypothetical protein
MQIARTGPYADDCEGVAKEIELCTRWRQLVVARDHFVWPVVEILRQYTTLMVTAAATSPSMKRAQVREDGKTMKNYICHVYIVLVPTSDVRSMIRGRGSARSAPRSKLPALLCEGTNYNSSLHLGAATYQWDSETDLHAQALHIVQRERVEAKSAFFRKANFRMYPTHFERVPEEDPEMSSFYRWVVECWCILPGTAATHYLFSRAPEDKEYGVPLVSLLKREDALRMVPVTLADEEQRLVVQDISSHLLNEPPVPAFREAHSDDGVLARLTEVFGCAPTEPSTDETENRPIFTSFIDYRFKSENIGEVRDAIRVCGATRFEWSYFPVMDGTEVFCVQVRLFVPVDATDLEAVARVVGK